MLPAHHRSVVLVIQLARHFEDDEQPHEHGHKCNPGTVKAEPATSEPERPHWVTLHYRRMAVDTAHGKSEYQSPARLPSEVEAPTEPQSLGAQISRGKQEAERN